MALIQIDEDLWSWERPVSMGLGFTFPCRSAVIRSDDGLIVYGPLTLDAETAQAIDALGEVRHLIGPNVFHHLFFGEAAARWPGAVKYGSRGLARRRPDLAFDVLLDGAAAPSLGGVQALFVRGTRVEEVVLVTPRSGSLVVADLVFNVQETANWVSSLLFGLLGVRGRVAQSPLYRMATRDRAAAAASCEAILGAEWNRLVMSHGRIVEHGGPAALREGLGWMLGGRRAIEG